MKKRVNEWIGQSEKTEIEYECGNYDYPSEIKDDIQISTYKVVNAQDEPDKIDNLVAASCGVLTGLLNSIWIEDFSLSTAQDWGRKNVNAFVIKVAHMRGYRKDELEGAIRFLEKDAPIPSDQLTPIWGGGLQHHFRDFAHHVSVTGLIFSVISQFTGKSYGTNVDGHFEIHEIKNKELIGKTFEEKIYNGTIVWALHLVSDMAGSSSSPGKGTGVPGPLLSLAKEISVLFNIYSFEMEYKGKLISFSELLSKIFNGTAFKHTGNNDLIRFDLRSEIGIFKFGLKQSIPIVINRCLVRAFYFVRRLYLEISDLQKKSIKDINKINFQRIVPISNKCILRMDTISSGFFCLVNLSDAAIRTFASSPQTQKDFMSRFLLKTNFSGIGNFVISITKDIRINMENSIKIVGCEKKKKYDNETSLTDKSITIEIGDDDDKFSRLYMNSKYIYDYAFSKMLDIVKQKKEESKSQKSRHFEIEHKIFCLEDYDTDLYSTVVNGSSKLIKREIQQLIMRLLNMYNINYYAIDDNNVIPFYCIEDGEKIGYIFTYSLFDSYSISEIINKKSKEKYVDSLDGIKVIALSEIEDTETKKFFDYFLNKEGDYVKCESIKSFFSIFFEEEYDVFKEYVIKFNSDVKRLIGYKTIVVPSDNSLDDFKRKVDIEFCALDYKKQLMQDNIYNVQINKIKNNYKDRSLYKAMTGNSSFAESFISSEWYYKNHAEFNGLEHTAIIAGYLKSVEQLLYYIIKLSEGKGKKIKKIGTGKSEYIEFSAENEPSIDFSLGSMIRYLQKNIDLWDVNSFVINYISNKLDEYRQKYRNDHFHKDNVYRIEEIEEIRSNTFFVIYLMLGAIKIYDNQKTFLGIINKKNNEDIKNDLTYFQIEQWLNLILMGGDPIDENSKIYFQVEQPSHKGRVRFKLIKGFGSNYYDPIPFSDRSYRDDKLEWDDELRGEELVKKVLPLINCYLENGKFSSKLKNVSGVYVGLLSKEPIELYKRQ